MDQFSKNWHFWKIEMKPDWLKRVTPPPPIGGIENLKKKSVKIQKWGVGEFSPYKSKNWHFWKIEMRTDWLKSHPPPPMGGGVPTCVFWTPIFGAFFRVEKNKKSYFSPNYSKSFGPIFKKLTFFKNWDKTHRMKKNPASIPPWRRGGGPTWVPELKSC